jgi:ABC-2 type transport system ATP-binding protein
LILGLKRQGRAVLVSTHNLAEAEELSDRIAVLKTNLLACDSVDNLRRAKAGLRVVIETEGAAPQSIAIQALAEIPGHVNRLVAAGARIVSVTPQQRSLEDVYLELVGADR